MPEKRVVELPEAPGTFGTYRKAALQRAHGRDRVPGKILRLTDVRPDVEHVKRYLDVCGGRLTDALPVLYSHMLGFPLQMALLTDPESPFAAMGLVHVANSVQVLRPVPLAATLAVEAEMAPPVPHRRGRTIDLLVRVSIDGETVWRSSSTYLKREKTDGDVASAPEIAVPDALPAKPGALWRLPADLGRQYGAVSGDRNPIHMSALTARAFGFPTAIAHGMWTAARALAALEGRLPDTLRNDVEFKQPVKLPGTVEFADDGDAKDLVYLVRSRTSGKDGRPKLHLVGSVTPL